MNLRVKIHHFHVKIKNTENEQCRNDFSTVVTDFTRSGCNTYIYLLLIKSEEISVHTQLSAPAASKSTEYTCL